LSLEAALDQTCGPQAPITGRAAAELFFQFDDDLLFASCSPGDAGRSCPRGLPVALPPPDLVEQLLTRPPSRHWPSAPCLPVPPAHVLELTSGSDAVSDLQLPVLLKPTRREASWIPAVAGKAVVVDDRDALPGIVNLSRTT